MSAYRWGEAYVRDTLAGRICETEDGYFSRINRLAKRVRFRQMAGFIDLRLAVGIPAAAYQQHSLVMKANIIHNGKLIVGYRLLKGQKNCQPRPSAAQHP